MLKAHLKRIRQDEHGMFGTLHITDEPICHTLEPPDSDNKENVSCIPAGEYIVTPWSSQRFGNVHKVWNVIRRSDILFHRGNFVTDTQGCILVGMVEGEVEGVPAVLDSRTAWREFKKRFAGKAFILTITDPA